MVTKSDCIRIFNAMIRGTPISFQDNLIPLVSEYLTENNVENSDKIINLIVNNPQLVEATLPKIINYYEYKYTILSIIHNNKKILYYE